MLFFILAMNYDKPELLGFIIMRNSAHYFNKNMTELLDFIKTYNATF